MEGQCCYSKDNAKQSIVFFGDQWGVRRNVHSPATATIRLPLNGPHPHRHTSLNKPNRAEEASVRKLWQWKEAELVREWLSPKPVISRFLWPMKLWGRANGGKEKGSAITIWNWEQVWVEWVGEEIERGSHGAGLEGTEMGEERRALKVLER